METIEPIMSLSKITVADVAMESPNSIAILNKYHLDYCCGGKESFKSACEKVNVDPKKVLEEIRNESYTHSRGGMNFKSWTPVLLTNFITQHHHAYVKRSIPEIKALLEKVCQVHGNEFPSIHSISRNFNELSDELLQHMNKEELILFPAINKLFEEKHPIEKDSFPFSIEQPISVMEDEHEHAGNLLKSIRFLSENYTPPSFACPTFKIAYTRLQEFDQDLTQHIHLENNVLFEKVKHHLSINV